MDKIIIKNAYEHNLKHLSLEIPLGAFTCVTGCSGCGKSSLVYDTIYAESQRGFLEGMSGNLYGQKLMNKPKVDSIENLHPALNISQNYYNVNPRSTIGTITEIAYYLRSLFAVVNSDQAHEVSESTFSSNNPKSFCPNCNGLGVENVVSEELLIPDKEKTLRDGAILFFKGSSESKEQKYLAALCEHYGISVDKRVSELSKEELDHLLYSDDNIRYKLSYKEGKRKKQHYVFLRGAVAAIQERLATSDSSEQSAVYARYMEETPCHVCGGSKLRQDTLSYKVGDLNYSEVENLELTSLRAWIREIREKYENSSKKNLIAELADGILRKLDALIRLNVGYLCIGRTIPSLSDGERQRIRIASQLTCSLKGLVYILDEPCKGLHYRDLPSIIQSTKDLVDRGNTVISIEHNKSYIAAADNVVELGPVGGPDGGYLMDHSNGEINSLQPITFKVIEEKTDFFEVLNIHFRNIKGQTARFPIGGITCITGVSGSGKSTLASVVANCFSRNSRANCDGIRGGSTIKRVIQVNQAPIGKTPRSTIVSYLGIYDDIRELFAATDAAHKLKLSASQFSMNLKGGRCEYCQGTGLQKIELNYLPSSYITCPECGGRRFNEIVLSVLYREKTIQDILEEPILDIIDLFKESRKIYPVLKNMMELGLGYLKLGQMSMNLSGGEAQRIKLAKALGTVSHGHNLYILDEPTSGLSDTDIEKFVKNIFSLQSKRDTIIIIEHNIKFIAKVADYIIDFGLRSGEAGGEIAAQGFPEHVFSEPSSSLYGLDKLLF